jgi:hypothetical protein
MEMNYEQQQLYKQWLETEKGYDFTLKGNESCWDHAYDRIVKLNNLDTFRDMSIEGQEEHQTLEDLQDSDYQEYMNYLKEMA